MGGFMQYSQRLGEAGRNDRRSMRGAFRPGLLPTLVILGLLPVLLWLGTWQLQRADEKRALLASYEARRGAEPVSPGQLEGLRDPAYVRVRLHGRFDERHTLLLDNRLRNGQAGVEVLQPFYDQASGLWLLVNRGWVAWTDRRSPPALETPDRVLLLDALTYLPPPGGLHLADAPAGGWPRLVTQLDIPALWQAFGRAGLPWEIRLEPGDASFDTDWPLVSMPPERHTGYAVQWFALATALLALYLYLGVRRAREKNHESRDSDA